MAKFKRPDGRAADALRPVRIEVGVSKFAEGSARIALNIYREIRNSHDWGKQFPEAPSPAALERLSALPPREMRRLIHGAFGNANSISPPNLIFCPESRFLKNVMSASPECYARRAESAFLKRQTELEGRYLGKSAKPDEKARDILKEADELLGAKK